jgi:hypothetical protein
MLNKYDIYERLVIIGGYTGRLMVWMGLLCGALLFWYLIISLLV